MADENIIINGVASEGDVGTLEIDGIAKKGLDEVGYDWSEMARKIEELELEKVILEHENGVIIERMGGLTVELQELRNDKVEMSERLGEMEKMVEQSELDVKATEAIATRAFELETEVSRLQHDFISSESEGGEANAEVSKLKSLLEEKVQLLKNLEKEKMGLYGEVEKAKSELVSMEVCLRSESSEKAKVEKEAKKRIRKKESEVNVLKNQSEDMESLVAKNAFELGMVIMEKKAEVSAENDAIEAAKMENEKVGVLESKLSSLIEELEESKRVISELKVKAIKGVNGVVTAAREDIFASDEKGMEGLKLQWSAVAVATGTVMAVAMVVYLRCAKSR